MKVLLIRNLMIFRWTRLTAGVGISIVVVARANDTRFYYVRHRQKTTKTTFFRGDGRHVYVLVWISRDQANPSLVAHVGNASRHSECNRTSDVHARSLCQDSGQTRERGTKVVIATCVTMFAKAGQKSAKKNVGSDEINDERQERCAKHRKTYYYYNLGKC